MAMTLPVLDMEGREVRSVELPDEVFGLEPNRPVMHQALVRQLANARQGTHATQTRSEVSRTTKKWYRQKGTGRARHGARTANLFVGGAVVHGPKPRSYEKKMPRRMRRLAVRSALSAKAAAGEVVLLDALSLDAPSTRRMAALIGRVCEGRSTLVVLPAADEAVERSIRNLAHVRFLRAGYLNVRDLLGYDCVLIPLDALEAIVAHLGAEAANGEADHEPV
jgi:large subunit ribosomal protein L4